MKKFLIKLVVLMPIVASLFLFGFNNLPKECGDNAYIKVCFDLGGLISRDGCVLPPSKEIQNSTSEIEKNSEEEEEISEKTVLDFGSIGAYHAVFDSNEKKWTLGLWKESATREGVGLSSMKQKATSVSFVMPYDGEINNSAGHIAINNNEWTLGNPAKDSTDNTIVKKGDSVTIWTDGPNDSAGFQIWFFNK